MICNPVSTGISKISACRYHCLNEYCNVLTTE